VLWLQERAVQAAIAGKQHTQRVGIEVAHVGVLQRTDKHLDARHLVLLALDQTLEQRRPNPESGFCPGDGALDDALEDRIGLDDVELGAVELAGGGLEQAGLEQLDRGGNAKQDVKLNAVAPGTAAVSSSSTVGESSRDALEERYQIRQQPALKRLAVLERNDNPRRLLVLLLLLGQKDMQRFEVIVEIFPPLHTSAFPPSSSRQ
jgi:hypothetical protein